MPLDPINVWGAILVAIALDLGLMLWAWGQRQVPRAVDGSSDASPAHVGAAQSDTDSRGSWIGPALVLISVACALRGQWLLTHADVAGSLLWFLAAGAGFVIPFSKGQLNDGLDVPLLMAVHRIPRFLIVSGLLSLVALSIIIFREQAGAHFYWDAVILWVGSCIAYLLAFRWPGWAWLRGRVYAHRWEILLVAGITVLAALLRFLWLDRIPDVMNGDEGLHGLFARGVLEGANRHPFSTFYGAGSLHLFVVAMVEKFLGYTSLATRVIPAIGGVLGVPATFLLARRLFGPRVAFVAAGLVAALHSHIQFSRVLGVGYIYATLFASLGVYLLYGALETGSRSRAALGGVTLGLWLYVYVDSRFVPAVLLAWFLILIVLPGQRAFILSNLKPVAAFGGGYLIAAAPMGLWALRHWDDFGARFASDGTLWNGYYASVLAQNPKLNLFQFLLDQLAHAFFSITRYPVWDFYQSPAPLLDLLTAALFWLALIYSAFHLLDRRHLLLNIWLWSGVAAVGLLTVPRSSDGYRLLTVFIPIVILVAVVAEQLAQRLSDALGGQAWASWSLLVVLLVAVLVINVNVYFRQFASSCRYGGDRATRTAYFMGTVLAKMRPGEHAIVLGNEYLHYGTHASAQYLNPGVDVQNVIEPLKPDFKFGPPPQAFIVIPERGNDLGALQSVYPGGRVTEVKDCGTLSLYVYAFR